MLLFSGTGKLAGQKIQKIMVVELSSEKPVFQLSMFPKSL